MKMNRRKTAIELLDLTVSWIVVGIVVYGLLATIIKIIVWIK